MERRRGARTRRRTPVEIVTGSERRYGFLLDYSRGGAFIQTERPLEPGTEIELRFAHSTLAPQRARARVARRLTAPRLAAAVMRSGIGIEWIEAPQFARDLGELDVEIEIDAAFEEPPALASHEAGDAQRAAERAEEEAREEEAPPADPSPRLETAPAESAAAPASGEASAREEIAALEIPPPVEQTVELSPEAERAEVVVIDEGDLGEIERLTRSLGARTLRLRWGAQTAPLVWEAPPRLVVVPGRIGIAVPLGSSGVASGAIGIAMCDSEASTLRAKLRRQGYELAVRRDAHPATLRLLFASLLFARRDRRKERRRPFGGDVHFWRGLHRIRGTLLELSESGGSILLADAPPRGTLLTVRIAGRHAGGRPLALPAVVSRISPSESGVLAVIRFDPISARKRARLAALLRRIEAAGPVPQRESQRASRPRVDLVAAREPRERRQSARVPVAQQALSIDPRTGVARDVLFGTDLSLGGMRIEPNPGLARGNSLKLALQPPGGAPPIVLSAEVVRDEGDRGLVLRFRPTPPLVTLALEHMLEAASEVERMRRSGRARGNQVVLGTLVEAPQS